MAGLQAGILAGIMTTLWFLIEAWRTKHPLWGAINLMSTAILGRSGYVYGFGVASLVGLSLHLVMFGSYGVLFSMLVSPRVRPFLAANIGLLFSFAILAVNFIWIYPRIAPIVYFNAARLEWTGAHFLGGMVLGLYPDMARSLLRTPVQLPVAPPDEPALGSEEVTSAI